MPWPVARCSFRRPAISAQEHYEGDFVDGGNGFHAFDGSSDITMRLRSPV